LINYIESPLWGKLVSRMIRAEMILKGMKYKDIHESLLSLGTHQSVGNLRQKIHRGQMSAQLFLQLMIVLEMDQLSVNSLNDKIRRLQSELNGKAD